MMTCQKLKMDGQVCGCRAVTFANNIWCCRRHTTFEPETLLYKYPDNTLLANLPESLPDEWVMEENYINFKIKSLLFEGDLPLVMMNEEITALSLARFILDNIKYLDLHPTEYRLKKHYDEFYIDRVSYDNVCGIYLVYLRI